MAEICGVEDLSVKLRQRRLRWFEHVKSAEEGVLGKVARGGGDESLGVTGSRKAYEKVE